MVKSWAGISIGGRIDIHVIRNGSLTAVRYRNEVLYPIVVPYVGAVGNNFLFMDNNARPRAHFVNNIIQEAGIERID